MDNNNASPKKLLIIDGIITKMRMIITYCSDWAEAHSANRLDRGGTYYGVVLMMYPSEPLNHIRQWSKNHVYFAQLTQRIFTPYS